MYHYGNNNPIKYVDPEGKSPNKIYSGTVPGLVLFMNSLNTGLGRATGIDAHDGMLRMGKVSITMKGPKPANTAPFNTAYGNRYIYTKKGGWIDIAHFVFYAGRAYTYKIQKEEATEALKKEVALEDIETLQILAAQDPLMKAVDMGRMQEFFDPSRSSYSYEDLPTDYFGADFAVNYFSPLRSETFAEQIQDYLENVLDAAYPWDAPNYRDLPMGEQEGKPQWRNKTILPMFTE